MSSAAGPKSTTMAASSSDEMGNFLLSLANDIFEPDIPSSDEELLLNMDLETIEAAHLATYDDPSDTGHHDVGLDLNVSSTGNYRKMQNSLKRPAMEDIGEPETPARFKARTDEELEQLFEARQAPSTKKNTAWGVKIFQDWSKETYGEVTDMNVTDPEALAEKLKKFYAEARPKPKIKGQNNVNDNVYHKNSLINIRGAINRHLADLKRNIDLVNDKEFKTANGVLDGLLKERVRMGTSKPTKHKEIIDEIDLKKISTYLSLAPKSPVILRHHVWYSLSVHFVTRGMEFHHQLKKNSFVFHNDDSGEYVTLNHEVTQKNHQGGINAVEASACNKRMYSTGSDYCPVKMLKMLIDKTHPNATSLFNKYDKKAYESPEQTPVWYLDQPLAKRTFKNFLPDICKAASLTKTYTSHCLRATAIQCLNDDGFQARHIMFMSSHRNETSLRSYTRNVCSAQKKSLSTALSAITNPEHVAVETAPSRLALCEKSHGNLALNGPIVNSESSLGCLNRQNSMASCSTTTNNKLTFQNTPGFFANSNFNNCVFNVHPVGPN